MKKIIFKINFLFALFVIGATTKTFAEGTPQLSPNVNTLTGVLVAPDLASGSFLNCLEDNRIYFRVGTNFTSESLYFGFDFRTYGIGSPLRATNVYYRIRRPNGSIVVNITQWNPAYGSAGSIDGGGESIGQKNSAFNKALVGPNIGGITTGYNPLVFNPDIDGEHYIEFFRSSDGGATADVSGTASRAVAPLFDMTVANNSGAFTKLPGRVHCDKWGLVALNSSYANNFAANSKPDLFVYTEDRVILRLTFQDGFQPVAYDLALNSYGVTNVGPFSTTRRSVNAVAAPPLPNGFKIFLTKPDPTYYTIATIPALPTFLSPAITGCGPFNIRFNTSDPGDVQLFLNLNGIAGFQANTSDRILEATDLPAGNNSVSWNGLDGQGNPVSDGGTVQMTLSYLKGRFNLPLYDAEINKGGFNIAIVEPIQTPNSRMYWDDSLLTNVGTTCVTNAAHDDNNVTGAGINNSIIGTDSPAHKWNGDGNPTQQPVAPSIGTSETDGLVCNDFGNVRLINTWGYGISSDAVTTTLFKGCSDLRVVKTFAPNPNYIGGQITFTITATNLSGSNNTNVVVTDAVPDGYIISTTTPPTATQGSYAGNAWTIGNLNVGQTVTLTIVATISTTGINFTNTAVVDGDNEEANPTDNTSTVTPTPIAPPIVSIGNAQILEGNTLSFPITLSNASGTDITLTFGFTNITTVNGDYSIPIPATVTIPAGSTTGTLLVLTVEDPIDELDETFTVFISGSTGVVGNISDTAIGTILDDDLAPTVTLTGTQTIAENAAGVATITATLSNPTTVPTVVTVAYTGTATNGTDYTPSSATITIPANSTTGTVTIDPTDDIIFEGDETVIIDITNVTGGNGATELGTQQAIVTIADNETIPTVTLTGTQTIAENAAGVATITATLSNPTTVPTVVTVAYTGTATNGTDYTPSSVTITIPAGDTTGTVTIDPIDDNIFEGNETVVIDITNVTGGNGALEFGTQQATVTIADDDTAPTVTLNGTQTIAEDAAGVATITATLSNPTTVATVVTVAYTGTATNGTDYTPSSVTITIPANSTTGTVTIDPTPDAIFEGDETVIIDITNVTGGNGATEATPAQQAIVTITESITGAPTVTLTGTQTIAENAAGVATITATLSNPTTVPTVVTVAYTGTATNGTDYTPSSVTITIPANSTTGTVTIDPTPDAIFEGDETVIIDITNVTGGNGATEATPAQQAIVTIVDNETIPTVTLIGTQTIAENAAGVATITATLSNPTTVPTVVTVAYTGTATNGTDYTPSSATITIPANSTTGTVTIDPTDDIIFEGDETVIIDITNVTGGNGATELGTQQAIVTIVDNETIPTVTLTGTQTIAENAAGVATITATLSNPTTVPTVVTVAYTGTATNGTDYTPSSVTITIPAGDTTGTVTIDPIDDNIFEGNETVVIDITNVTGGNGALEFGTQQATVTIADDDTAPTVTLNGTQTIAEDAAGVATITATLSNPTTVATVVTVAYTGTATNGTDYTPSSVTITIPANSTTGTVTIDPTPDAIFEGDETVIIDITNVTGGNGATEATPAQQAIVTITESITGAPTVTLTGTQTIAENAAGVATITATLSNPTTVPTVVTVAYTGTATNGTDYTPSSATITIPANSTTGTVTIDPTDDIIFEGDETVIIDITNVTGGNGATEATPAQQAIVTIVDNETIPTVTLTGTQTIAENAAGVATITATLSNPTTVPTVVTVAYTGTATNGTDYTPSSVTITIPAGDTTGTVTIDPTDDIIFEGNETVIIDITNVTGGNGATELGTQQAIVTIADNETIPTVTLTGTQTIAENAAGVATITATLSFATTVPTVVTVAYTGTATNGTDYTPSSVTITIPAGDTTGTVTIDPIDDNIFEGNETVVIDITNVTGGNGALEFGTQQATVTIADDDTAPTVTLTGIQTIAEDAAGVATITATLSNPTTVATVVTVAYTGTATNGTDYTPSSVTITIPANSTTGTVTIDPTPDAIFEGDETVIIDITNVTGGNGATEATPAQQAIVTITESITGAPTVTLTGTQTIAENAAGVATITATLSNPTTVPTVVTVAYTGTATNGTDYTPSSATITIPANSTTGTVTIDPTDDIIFEGDETVIIDITNVTGGNGATEATPAQQAIVTIVDNETIPTVTLTGTQTIAENAAGVATITATLSNPTTVPTVVTVAYTGTATNGTDYTPSSVTITIPAGDTTGTVTIDPTDDIIFEGNETVIIDITNVTGGNGATELGTQQAIVTIADNETIPTVTLTGTQTIAENAAGVATITATLSFATTVPTVVTVAYTGTATNGTDYTPSSVTITIPAGDTTGTVTIDPIDDNIFEGNETVVIDITNVTGGNGALEFGTQQATVTIADDDTAPTVTLTGTQTIAEDAAGVATITATLSNPTTVATVVTVAYTGTATNGTDYTPSSVTITIPANSTTGTVTIDPTPDAIFEGDETVIIDITNVTGGNGATEATPAQQAIVTITESITGAPTVTLTGTQTIAENAAGVATITATLSNPTTVPTVVTVAYTGTATNGTDYTPSSATITIPANSTTGTVTIDPTDDIIFEGDETVIIDITNVTGGNGATEATPAQQAIVTIVDNETIPTVTLIGTQTIAENAAGVATITATLSNPTTVPTVVTVAYTGTATNGTDYTPSSVTITIPAGDTTGTVTIDPTDDIIFEGNETVVIDITNVTGGNGATELGTQQAIVTIADNDPTPSFTITGNTATEGTPVTFTSTLSGPSSTDTVITVVTNPGTATSPEDYNATPTVTTITIPAGSLTGTTTVTTVDDNIDEPQEQFTLTGTVTSGNTSNLDATGTGTIDDNDSFPILTVFDASTSEGNTINFTLELSNPSYVPTTILLSTANNTGVNLATSGSDYAPLTNLSVTIPAGETTVTIPAQILVNTFDDSIDEQNETFLLNALVISTNINIPASDLTGVGTIIDNDGTIVALNDIFNNIECSTTNSNLGNLLSNDSINNLGANSSNVNLTITSNPFTNIVIDNDGNISIINTGLAVGQYTIQYQICENGNSGNCANAFVIINITDTITPIVPVLVDLNGQCSVTAIPPTTTDACSGTITATTSNPLVYNNQGNYVIIWNFNDGNGNSINVNQNIIVDDTTAPVIPVLVDLIGQCSVTATPPTTTDNCAGTITATSTNNFSPYTQGTYIITWNFNDGNGQTISVNQNVIVDDTIAPVIPVLPDLTGQCSVTATPPTTTDNCAGTITATSTNNFSPYSQGTYIISWNFNDGNGQTISVNQNVIVDDTIAPVIPVLPVITAQCSTTLVPPTTTDNCSSTPIVATTNLPSLTIVGEQTIVVPWTFNDGHGNFIVVNQTVIIDDTIAPIIPVLADVVGQCSATATPPTTTDNCAGSIIATSTNNFSPYNNQGTYVIVWNFSDGNGNSFNVNQNVIVDNTVPPVIPALTDVTGQCSATALTPTFTNTCTGAIISAISNINPPTRNTQGTTVITWTFDDGNGNVQTLNQNLIVDDTTAPVIPVLPDLTGQCSVTATPPTTTDNCAGSIIATSTNNFSPYNNQGTYVITWDFNDGNGQTISVNQNVIVDDTIAPVIPVLPDLTGQCSVTATPPTTTDNCAGTITATSTNNFSPYSQGTYIITWNFNDGNGQTISVNQNVIVDDTIAPVIPVLPVITAQCSTTLVPPTTTDNCSSTPIVATTNLPSLTIVGEQTIVVPWTFNDGHGNSIVVNQTVIIDDTIAPIIPVLADVVGQCSATATPPTTTDNCAGSIIATSTNNFSPYNNQGTYVITWNFSDGNGNTFNVNQNVIVDNTVPPVIPILTDVTGQCSATALTPTFTNTCTGAIISAISNINPPTRNTQGTTVITWTFDDGNGNVQTLNQNLIVDDTTAPVIPVLPDLTGQCSVTATPPTTTDNCAGSIIATSTNNFSPYNNQGTYVITWDFNDGNGQTISVNQNVIVDDTIAPVIPVLPDLTGQCSVTATPPTTTDNCAGTITATSTNNFSPYSQGTYIITWNFNDGNGQTISVNQNVIVDDTIAPVIPVLPVITAQCSTTLVPPTTTDNCSSTPIVATTNLPSLTIVGEQTIVVPWTFNDGHGNSIVVNQTVIIDDTIAPIIPVLADVVGQCSATATPPTTTDNCAGSIIATSTNNFSPYNNQGTYVITWNFSDGNGNTFNVNQNVIVDNTVPPVIPILTDVTGQCSATALTPTFTNTCTGAIISAISNINPPTRNTQGTTVITWTFDDGNGNVQTLNQNLIVDDTTAPVIPVLPDLTGQCSVTATPPTTTDNCAGSIIATSTNNFSPYNNQGTYVITWDFNDGNGQTISVNQNVIVDNNLPLIIPPLATITEQCIANVPTPTFTNVCTGAMISATTSDDVTNLGQGNYTINWNFNDGNGNVQVLQQSVIVNDSTPPVVINQPVDTPYECITDVPAVGSLNAIDNCAGTLTSIGVDTVDNTNPCNIIITRTWTFNDGTNPDFVVTQIITVKDTTAPVFTGNLPDDITVECSDDLPTNTVQATDNCSTTPINATFTDSAQIPLIGLCPLKYKIERTWIAKDACGNSSLPFVQVINFKDTTKPTATGITTPISATCDLIDPAPAPVFNDNCTASTSLILTPMTEVVSTISPTGTYTITREWGVSDGCNSETFTQVVNVTISNYIQQVPQLYAECNINSVREFDLLEHIKVTYPTIFTNGTWFDINNSGFDKTTGIFKPFNVAVGDYLIEYQNSDPKCPSTVKFTIRVDDDCSVLDCETFELHNAITANNDTINDSLVIDGIESDCYKNNTLEIFNRWGIKVYEKENYDNVTDPFTGVSDGRSTIKKGELLPTGTYFYSINFRSKVGDIKPESGFIYLTRD